MSRLAEDQSGKNSMQYEMNEVVRAVLGKDFYIRTVTVGKGSIELLVILATVGTIYMGFSRYKNFIESGQLLQSQLEGIIRKFISEPGEFSSTWVPGPSLAFVETAFSSGPEQATSAPSLTMIVIWYLILSHAALLAAALWTIFKKALS